MSKVEKPSLLEIVRTFWPVLLFIIGILVWALQMQTVSSSDFTSLKIRTTLIEEQIPNREMILRVHEDLVRMETKIEQLSKSITRIENLMFKKYRSK